MHLLVPRFTLVPFIALLQMKTGRLYWNSFSWLISSDSSSQHAAAALNHLLRRVFLGRVGGKEGLLMTALNSLIEQLALLASM